MIYQDNILFETDGNGFGRLITEVVPRDYILSVYRERLMGNVEVYTSVSSVPKGKESKGICFVRIVGVDNNNLFKGNIDIKVDDEALIIWGNVQGNLEHLVEEKVLKCFDMKGDIKVNK